MIHKNCSISPDRMTQLDEVERSLFTIFLFCNQRRTTNKEFGLQILRIIFVSGRVVPDFCTLCEVLMSEQEKANIHSAYQIAAEMTYLVAVGLSKAKEKSEARKMHRHRNNRTPFSN
ncbi:hypothetical protein [Scytonema hofmannii]|uniref:hypothetical protein n=1 Tax=Scytonema hofmannii TaxID=34078 RepID=UPI0011DFA889|nr:hypothetical protein [Scytonema hofmannii]